MGHHLNLGIAKVQTRNGPRLGARHQLQHTPVVALTAHADQHDHQRYLAEGMDAVLTKPPSAELRPDQQDTDSLPPYEELDPIIAAYVEDDLGIDEIVAAGIGSPGTVTRVAAMIDRAEYKRRQAAPGVKITPKAFGKDRRLPITNRYVGHHDPG